ncbi:hypothetical protein ACFPVY_04035 [Flavobacterium qiangtangense]|uniref:Phage tail tape measure protein n=1 Tax=Flavobacterium qiangtangense TaxID=1442595 RepID=A0ABW1PKZ0_9FLAO
MIKRTAEIQINTNANEAKAELQNLNAALDSNSKAALANEVAIRELAEAQHKLELAEKAVADSSNHTATAIQNMENNVAKARLAVVAKTEKLEELTASQARGTSITHENTNAIASNGGAIAILDSLSNGMATSLRDLWEMSSLFTGQLKLQSIQQAIMTTVVGTSTGAWKAFRIAMAASGVGLLVVGLTMLIMNFETVSKWVSNITDKFGGWRNVLMFIAPPIYLIIKALEMLGIMETEAEEKSRKAWEDRQKRNAEATKAVMKQRQVISDYMDFEIAKANALGKDTVILEQVKREAILNTAKAYNDLNRELINSGKATQDQIKAWNANQELINKTKNDQILADLRVQKIAEDKAKEARDKAVEDAKKSAADRKAAREKAAADELAERKRNDEAYKNAQIKLNKELEDLQDTTDQQKLDRMKSRYVEEINALKGKTAEEKAILIASLDEQFKIRQADLDKKTKEEAAKKEEDRQKAIQDLIDKNAVEKVFADAKTVAEVEAIRYANEQKLIQQENDDILAAEKLGASEEEIASIHTNFKDQEIANNEDAADSNKRISDLEDQERKKKLSAIKDTLATAASLLGEHTVAGKAMAIAATTIDTYQSSISAYKGMVAAVPGPVGIAAGAVAAAASIASGFATVKKILSVRVGKSGAGGAGGGGAATGGGVSIAKPSVSFQNTQQGQVSESIQQTSANRNAQPIQVQVSSNEITNAQRVDSETISNARYN